MVHERWIGICPDRVLAGQIITILSIAAFLLIALTIPDAAANQHSATSEDLSRAREYYDQARFKEAVNLLVNLFEHSTLRAEEAIAAREILARSYVKLGNESLAVSTFIDILRRDPSWRPDPLTVPPDEINAFNAALDTFHSRERAYSPQRSFGPPPDTSPLGGRTPARRFQWGAHAGINLGTLHSRTLDDEKVFAAANYGRFDQRTRIGPAVGLRLEWYLSQAFSVGGELGWLVDEYRNEKDHRDSVDSSGVETVPYRERYNIKLQSIEAPIFVKCRLSRASWVPRPYAGPIMGLSLAGKGKYESTYGTPFVYEYTIDSLRPFYFGITAGLEISLFHTRTLGVLGDVRLRQELTRRIPEEDTRGRSLELLVSVVRN